MYSEIDIFGVYVAPFAMMMLAAWLATFPLNRIANHFSLSRKVWHPGLFSLCIYIIILSLIVLYMGPRQ
ncbi:uncharacterized protein DUF1656 [Ancylobacter aquaticus]|uniref:Uncharacterized protein DUF1656 n=1 Tax=Ancylobacter aquaticus TaxID=100 RepID=A0A4R1I257_ANCAQ|nr:DUF1656 domain-containing protein [Ancylobacter aquaticus]TCK28013.1 uncharacterized protein DUF1656 [Ancylobacter aquaticus]